MYLSKNGITDKFIQYECKNISQVKNMINDMTNTLSVNDDWEDMCYQSKKQGEWDSCDYIYFDNNEEKDCSVCVGYDKSNRTYLVWIEV